MLKREDGKIDWAWPAARIYNRMRGFAPWPGAYSALHGALCHLWGRPAVIPAMDGAEAGPGEIRVVASELHVACGDSSWLRIEFVQREGRKRITAREFVSGARLVPGDRFGGP
jgi:methionyl-tRNA formyltransferase